MTVSQIDETFEDIEEVEDWAIQMIAQYQRETPLHARPTGLDEESAAWLLNEHWWQIQTETEEKHHLGDCESLAHTIVGDEALPKLARVLQAAKRVRLMDEHSLADDLQELSESLQFRIVHDVDSGWISYLSGEVARLAASVRGESAISSPTLILPPGFGEFSHDLMRLLARDPELMFKTQPYVFERVVAAIFERFHMDVQVTQRTRDGGYDVMAIEETKYTKNQYIIEVKRYDRDKKIGLGVVQRLYGVKTDLAVTKAFLVTSSSFSRPAREFARQHAWELELKDYNDLVGWLKLHWTK